jgi:hypothetical protein
MKHTTHMKFLQAAAVGSIVASLLIVTLTIVGEEWAPLKDWLKNAFTHHWLGKGALSIAVFSIVTLWQGYVCTGEKATQAVWYAVIVALLSAATMTGFFILHTLQIV